MYHHNWHRERYNHHCHKELYLHWWHKELYHRHHHHPLCHRPLQAQGDLYKEFLKGIDMYNFRAKCWGEKNIDLLVAGAEAAKEKCMNMESHLLQPR